MSRLLRRGFTISTLALAPLFLVPASADEIGELLRAWSGPAAATADAAQGKTGSADALGSSAAATGKTADPAKAPAPVSDKATSGLQVPAPVPATRPVAVQPNPSTSKSVNAKVEATTVTPAMAQPVAAKTDTTAPAVVPSVTSEPGKSGKDVKPPSGKDAIEAKKPPMPAKQLFGAVKAPADLSARSIGWYAKGCLAGAKALAVDGPGWQVMRLSRNRNWGHPVLISLIERLAKEVTQQHEWGGLLVGDISQPRGGPMLTGHASHQVGLDADIWLTPAPDRTLSRKEREDLSATSMLAADDVSVNPKVFGEGQIKLIKRAASYSAVERVLVHPAIKKALCDAPGADRGWLSKVRPYFGHYYHFHIRIGCPAGSTNCKAQPAVPGDDGCGDELKGWLKRVAPKPPSQEAKPAEKPAKPAPKKPEITLADLPPECRTVLLAGGNKPPTEPTVVDLSKDAAPAKGAAPEDGAVQAAQHN